MSGNKESLISKALPLVKLLCVLAVVYFVVRCIDAAGQEEEIEIQDTPVVIESIKPIGELYAYTAITEDFSITSIEKVSFFIRRNYKAVQTLRMKVSFVMNLDSVDYVRREGTDTVVVRLPQLRYVQSAQGGRLLCEEEVPADQFNAASAIRIAEEKIRSNYNTQANRNKAMQHVHEVLTAFVQQCGLIPLFEDK